MDNGIVVKRDGGVPANTPPSRAAYNELLKEYLESSPAILAGYPGKEQPDPVRPTGAVLVDLLPDASPPATWAAWRGPRSPGPRQLPAELSLEQAQMRKLAALVGMSFARHPGVARAGLDQRSFVDLFTAVIHRESGFNPRAVSPAGAKGLGQLMPSTAREMGVCNVFSARQNLTGSARYLTAMLEEFGSPELALAAYNAGPGAVRKYGGVPPYPETRQYVSAIVSDMGLTTELAYGEGAKSIGSADELSIFASFDNPLLQSDESCDRKR